MKIRKDSLRGGEIFGRLTVIEFSHTHRQKNGTHMARMMRCRCLCGKIVIVATPNLKSGNTVSCGCYRTDRTISSNQQRVKEKKRD
jgi:hypothetical protein